jgi:hypothetical protein
MSVYKTAETLANPPLTSPSLTAPSLADSQNIRKQTSEELNTMGFEPYNRRYFAKDGVIEVGDSLVEQKGFTYRLSGSVAPWENGAIFVDRARLATVTSESLTPLLKSDRLYQGGVFDNQEVKQFDLQYDVRAVDKAHYVSKAHVLTYIPSDATKVEVVTFVPGLGNDTTLIHAKNVHDLFLKNIELNKVASNVEKRGLIVLMLSSPGQENNSLKIVRQQNDSDKIARIERLSYAPPPNLPNVEFPRYTEALIRNSKLAFSQLLSEQDKLLPNNVSVVNYRTVAHSAGFSSLFGITAAAKESGVNSSFLFTAAFAGFDKRITRMQNLIGVPLEVLNNGLNSTKLHTEWQPKTPPYSPPHSLNPLSPPTEASDSGEDIVQNQIALTIGTDDAQIPQASGRNAFKEISSRVQKIDPRVVTQVDFYDSNNDQIADKESATAAQHLLAKRVGKNKVTWQERPVSHGLLPYTLTPEDILPSLRN